MGDTNSVPAKNPSNDGDFETVGHNVCALVVTHNPDNRFESNLNALMRQVGHVIIIDNGSVANMKEFSGAELIRLEVNVGIAAALNRGVTAAISRGFKWVLTMDQDSLVHDDFIRGLSDIYVHCPFRNELGVVAGNFEDVHRRRYFVGYPSRGRPFIEQAVAITSGSLVRVDAIRTAGPFRDDFFIDFVDHEFCLRLRRRGWRIVYSRRPLLDHAIGDPSRHSLLGLKPATSNHSPLRRYYITRNRLVTDWNFFDSEPRAVITDLWRFVGETVALLLFERDRPAKIRAILAGIRDAVLGRMGPRHGPPVTRRRRSDRPVKP